MASIAKGETNFATQQNLKNYFEEAKILPDAGTRFAVSAAALPDAGGGGSIKGGGGAGSILDSGIKGGVFPVFNDTDIKDVATIKTSARIHPSRKSGGRSGQIHGIECFFWGNRRLPGSR